MLVSDEATSEQVELTPKWPDNATENPAAVNQFAVLWDGSRDAILLVAGLAAPPIAATRSDGLEHLERLAGRIPIVPKSALYMTRTQAEQLHELLGRHLKGSGEDD